MGTDRFSAIDASIAGSEEPGFLMVNARLMDNSDRAVEEAIGLIHRSLDELVAAEVGRDELDRALNRFEANFTFSCVGFLSRAQTIASYEVRGEDVNSVVPRYRDLTPERLRLAAADIFDPSKACALVYRPA
jgi:hypothetical protein